MGIEFAVNALDGIIIYRGCFERCYSNKLAHTSQTLVSQRFESCGRRCSVRPHTVHRPRLALGDGAATRVG